jgi:hypothetical protein
MGVSSSVETDARLLTDSLAPEAYSRSLRSGATRHFDRAPKDPLRKNLPISPVPRAVCGVAAPRNTEVFVVSAPCLRHVVLPAMGKFFLSRKGVSSRGCNRGSPHVKPS